MYIHTHIFFFLYIHCIDLSGKYFLRIIESLELEKTFKGYLAHLPCNEQRHTQPDHVAQGLIQPHFESL